MAEASVGVAIPAIMDPKTRTIKTNGRARVFKTSEIEGDCASGLN